MENSLSPAFVKINYQSRWGIHSMVVPSVPLIAAVGDAPPYFDLRGAEIDVNADTAIRDYIAVIAPFFPTVTTFVDYLIYSQPGVGDAPVPVWSASLAIPGDNPSTADDKATQMTWTYRGDDFTLFKQVFLDVPSGGTYDKVTSNVGNPAALANIAYVVAPETWIASRGGGRPNTYLATLKTKNEKLRRSYRMT